jgi:hypothetical protein
VLDQRRVLGRVAEPGRVGNLTGERFAGGGREAGEERRVEEAGGDRDDADRAVGKLAGDRQGQPGDARLGGGVGDLADLALVGGDRCGVDDDTACTLVNRFLACDGRGGQPQHVEHAGQVHVNRRLEAVQVQR